MEWSHYSYQSHTSIHHWQSQYNLGGTYSNSVLCPSGSLTAVSPSACTNPEWDISFCCHLILIFFYQVNLFVSCLVSMLFYLVEYSAIVFCLMHSYGFESGYQLRQEYPWIDAGIYLVFIWSLTHNSLTHTCSQP